MVRYVEGSAKLVVRCAESSLDCGTGCSFTSLDFGWVRMVRRHMLSTLGDPGPPLLPLRRRSLFDTSGDGPHVPRWIHNPPGAIAPELVLHWKHDLRPSGHRPLHHFVDLLDIDEDHDRRTAVRLRSAARKGW